MQVQSIKIYYSQPNFSSWNRVVYNESGKIINCNKTSLCREVDGVRVKDFWSKFINYVLEKYKDVPKVNVYSFGCSNGAEAITFVGGLKAADNNEFLKFMPVLASDCDRTAIEEAQKKRISIGFREAKRFDKLTNGQFGEMFYTSLDDTNKKFEDYFLSRTMQYDGINIPVYIEGERDFYIRPNITEYIQYKVANALEEVNNIEPDNTIVNAANMWFYLGKEKANEFAKNLFNKLGDNSCIRVGDFDNIINIDRILLKTGFVMSKLPYVYEKPSKPAQLPDFPVLA